MTDSLPYYTYIVRCADDSFYTGITTNLERRLKQHNGLLKGGALYTRTRRPVVMVYHETYATRSLASQREYAVKQYSHGEKEQLCVRG